MRGVSRDSFDRAKQALAAVAPEPDLGGELFSVARLLDTTGALRRVLTDPGRSAGAKKGMAEELLRGKISDQALSIVATAVTGRWSGSRDLADALDRLSVEADIGYADGAQKLDEVEDELFRLERVVARERALSDKLVDRRIPAEHRQKLVRELLEGKADQSTIQLAERAVVGRGLTFAAALAAYQEVAAERRNARIATVRVAVDLTAEERNRLAGTLSRQYGRDIQLNVIVDPSVIGGVRVDIGGEVIDSTIAARLEDAQRRIAG